MSHTAQPIWISATVARAAHNASATIYVLGTSLVLSAAAMSLAWIIPALAA